MLDPRVSEPAGPFLDRSARLALFGSLSILVGAVGVLFGLAHAVLLLAAGRFPGLETLPADARSYVMGALLYVLLGAAFVAVGLGSIRKRRWARPLMLTLAWTWMLAGVSALFLLPGMLDLALQGGARGAALVDPTLAGLVRTVLMVGAAGCGVILPALFVWIYNDPHLRRTCEAHDPLPDWTERCPPSVLGLSVGLGACGIITALTALRPAVPLFGRLVTGWPGGLALLAGAGLCLWLAWETYALRMRGWWATTVFLVLLGVSTWLTLERVPPVELFRAMGYPEDALPADEATLGSAASWLTAVLTLLTVFYMVRVREHFRKGRAAG